MANPKLLTDEQLTINVPQAESGFTAQPQTPAQAPLLNMINNPPPPNAIEQIAAGPQNVQGPSFGHEVANMLIGEIPIVGQILQKRHNQSFLEDQQAQQFQALATGAKRLPEEQQSILGNLLQQGRPDDAKKQYLKFAEMNVSQGFKSGQSSGLRNALTERVARIQDPVFKRSMEELMEVDPKAALIQVGQHETQTFSQGMQVTKENRAALDSQLKANEALIKDLKDDSAGKRALGIEETLRAKNFKLEDADLSAKKFMEKFGFDKKEAAGIQLQLKNHLKQFKTDGLFFKDYPPELRANPASAIEGVHSVYASPDAIAKQKQQNEMRGTLQQQQDAIRKQITDSEKPVKKKPKLDLEAAKREALKRGLKK